MPSPEPSLRSAVLAAVTVNPKPRAAEWDSRTRQKIREAIVLDEWVRTSSDELLECSAVLAELKAAKGLDLVRCVVGAGGKLRYV